MFYELEMQNHGKFNTDDKKIQAGFQDGRDKRVIDLLTIPAGGTPMALNDELNVGEKLPEGAIIVDAYVQISDTSGANGQLSMGLRKHKLLDEAETLVAEDDNSLVDVADSGGQSALKRSDNTSVALGSQVGVGGAQAFIKCVEAMASIPAGGLKIVAVVEFIKP